MSEAGLSRNSSSFTWGGDGPPRTLPKIPLFGPAAQLSPQVLLTRLHELDAISVGQGRLKPGALTPRAPPSEQRQLTLPTLQGAGGTTAGKFYASGSHSARGPREAGATLAAMLYKGDHTHCLPEVHGLRPRTPPTDGVAPRPARGRGGTPATPAADLNASTAALTVSDTASVKGMSPSPSSLLSLATTVPIVAKLAHRAKKMAEITPEELARRAALRSSFKHEASAIDSAMSRLRRWQMLIDMQELLDSDEQTRMQGLLDRLENSGLQMLPPRHSADAATWGSLSDDVQEQPPEDDHERSAPRFELSCCVSVLNFIRWLCGLPPVRLHAIRQVMCKVIAVALLPRLADPQVRLGRGPSDLGDYVAKLVGDEGRINVLHCEASLVLAIEKSIAATHLTTAPTKVQDRETAARALAERVEAAQNAFPPQDIHGICPLSLLEGGKAPWSIMPNGSKFQPTSQTGVRAWRVRIDKSGKDWTAERTEEVPILGFAVDCSMQGEPFCVIFWPGMARQAANGDQLEVNLFGLCGPVEDLTFFYEFRAFHQVELDASLCSVAAKTRALLGEASLWAEPRPAAVAATPAPSPADDWLSGQSVDSQPAAAGKLPGGGKQRQSTHQVTWRQGTRPTGAPGSPGSVNGSITRPPRLETLSHHQTTFSTNSVDLKVLLRGPNAAVLQADLFVVRFGEIEEQVPHGAQVQKLEDSTFIVLAKLPMARCRYELRFKASRKEAPVELQAHPFKYLILAGEQSPQLLSSLEDPRARIFGYARISPDAQQHGTFILSPMLHRIVVGNCYFLVYVDKALALAPFAEEAAAAAAAAQQDILQLPSSRKEARPSPPTSAVAPPPAAAGQAHAGNARGTTTTLFSKRLLPKDGPYAVSSIVASSRQMEPPKGNPDVAELHQTLRRALEPRTQDVSGDVHMDLLSQSGDCLRQLKERSDFPGLYEGLVRFGDSEVGKVIRLVARFPKAQAAEFAPKTMCEWYVCRADHFPPNF